MEDTKTTSKVEEKKSKVVVKKDEAYHPRIRLKIRAYDHKIIDRSIKTIIDVAERTGAKVIGPIPLPTEKSVYTVLRSTFVHKDAREQFERRVHKRLIDILEPTPKTIEEMTALSLPAGVDIQIKMN